ncbi:MAG: class I SAM-dependent methyltransferase [Gammaproteobacteria bacterium]|nr:class I SAM-dependent methyltransferase [Gammaproteobacteria bacterium]MDH5728724.1 class I SAM-dependent methyltransferase [Gammaproteobacteria bacterium]
MNKPFAESCVQNRKPIEAVLINELDKCHTVLEIGSGTGQHAVYFTETMPHLLWQTSDRSEYHQAIHAWIQDAKQQNVLPPLHLDVCSDQWPDTQYDAVFSANTLHIMSQQQVQCFFKTIRQVMKANSKLCVYGPFNYNGAYTSDSNAQFDLWLKQRDPLSCIKDFEWINSLAIESNLALHKDHPMPANNRLLTWIMSN